MRNHKKIIFYTAIIVLILLAVFYFYPRKINKEYNGVMYRNEDTNYSENIKVKISGSIRKRLFKGDKFEGELVIGNKQLTNTNIIFSKFHRGILYYYDEISEDYKPYGDLISSNLKDSLTICVLELNEQKSGSSSWSSKDGLMISAPANTRNEALDISNKLMKDILVNNKLK